MPTRLAQDGPVTLGDGRDVPPVPELTSHIVMAYFARNP